MGALLRLYQYLNILSIDIALGAVVSALFFAKIFEAHVKPQGAIALALTVWIIYTVDHLRDAKKIKHTASTQRHRFHQLHFRTLVICVCIILALDMIMISFISPRVLRWGLILSGPIGLYLILQNSLWFLKEFFIAALYTCGVLLLSLALTNINLATTHLLLIAEFLLIAWINLVLFAWFDRVFDTYDKQHSLVTRIGKSKTEVILWVLFLVSLMVFVIHFFLEGITFPGLILFAMMTTLFFIFIGQTRVKRNDLYRLIGDAVFIIPIVMLV